MPSMRPMIGFGEASAYVSLKAGAGQPLQDPVQVGSAIGHDLRLASRNQAVAEQVD